MIISCKIKPWNRYIQRTPLQDKPKYQSALGPLLKVGTKKRYNFLIPQPKHVEGTQKNRLNEMVILSTQNIC